jgi:hypothetical protein
MTRKSDEMLAAYVDGVSELSPVERERIEARLADSAELRAEQLATRDVLDQLRGLGGADREHVEATLDWAAMERSIRDAVGPDVPRPWWKRWRASDVRWWIVPGLATVAAATAILVIVLRSPSHELGAMPAPSSNVAVREPVAPVQKPVTPPSEVAPNMVWLDGDGVVLGPEADEVLDELELGHLRDMGPSPLGGVELVVSDLRWVDDLDDDVLDGIENALERETERRKKG